MFKQMAMATVASAALATSASAAIHNFTFPLTVAEEVPPPVGASGSGTATVTLDDVSGAVTVSGSYTGMTSNVTAAHIHGPAGPGFTAPPIITLTNTGGTSGTLGGGGTLTAGQVTDMLNGLHYINVHTVNNGPGELRGQVVDQAGAVPTVSEWGLIVLGLMTLTGGTLVIRRRMARPALAA